MSPKLLAALAPKVGRHIMCAGETSSKQVHTPYQTQVDLPKDEVAGSVHDDNVWQARRAAIPMAEVKNKMRAMHGSTVP